MSEQPPQQVQDRRGPVYIIYPGNHERGNFEYQQTHIHVPPPKYEDVINGTVGQPRPTETYPAPADSNVVLVTPVQKYTKAQKTLAMVFLVFFFVGFLSVFIKVLSFK